MEYIGFLSSFMLVITLVSIGMQLFYGYTLQALAKKNDMSSLGETLAWLPLLNIYPFIVCGGGSFPKFLIGMAAFAAAGIGSAVMAGSGGSMGIMGAVVIGGGTLGVIFYFGRLLWRTAERRGLHGFVGLLSFVPVVNLFVYPYIAFHDGFVPLNKVGATLGLILIAGPSIAQYQMMKVATSTMETQMAAAMEEGSMEGFSAMMEPTESTPTRDEKAPPTPAELANMKAMKLSMQLSMFQASDPEGRADRADAERRTSELAEIRRQFSQIEGLLSADRSASLRQAMAKALVQLDDMQPAGLEFAGQKPAAGSYAPPAAPALPVTSVAFDPMAGFAVPDDMSCRPGTDRKSNSEGRVWCEHAGGGLKHGWSSSKHASGALAAAGQYRDGLQHGVWTRWYDDGSLRVQAEFDRGLQQGRLISWDQNGYVTANLQFEAGEIVRR